MITQRRACRPPAGRLSSSRALVGDHLGDRLAADGGDGSSRRTWSGEWLPKMMMFSTSVTANTGLLRQLGRGAVLVQAGHRGPAIGRWCCMGYRPRRRGVISGNGVDGLALADEDFAIVLSRSARSMPGPRGFEPTNRHQLASLKATMGSSVRIMSWSRGKHSRQVPSPRLSRPLFRTGISSSCNSTGLILPKASPRQYGIRGSADLTSSAGHGNFNRGLHGVSLGMGLINRRGALTGVSQKRGNGMTATDQGFARILCGLRG